VPSFRSVAQPSPVMASDLSQRYLRYLDLVIFHPYVRMGLFFYHMRNSRLPRLRERSPYNQVQLAMYQK
jgi:hypothetical protein